MTRPRTQQVAITITVASLAVAAYRVTGDALPPGLPGTIIASVAALVVAYIASALIAMWVGR